MARYEKTTVKIPSAKRGWNLEAWQYVPTGANRKPPVIVMAHGFTGTKSMSLEPYAEKFAGLGYGFVLFDYRCFGGSDGTPRNFLSNHNQLEDYRSVIAHVRRSGSPFDGARVIAFGSSYSGGHITRLASEKSLGLAAAVGQCPYMNPILTTFCLSPISVLRVLFLSILDLIRRKIFGGPPVYVDAVCEPGEAGALSLKGIRNAYQSLLHSPKDHPNKVQAAVVWEVSRYWPVMRAASIQIPYMLVVLKKDECCPAGYTRSIAEKAPKGEFVELDGGHFDPYPGHPCHEDSLKAMVDFVQRTIPV